MKVKGLNGRDYTIPLKKYMGSNRSKVSFYHSQAREIIQIVFSGDNILEEVKLPGTVNPSKKAALFLDFFIPNLKIGVEVHGQQHFKYIPFFHKSKAGFMKARARDRDKAEWCDINNITLVVLRFDSSPEHWRKQLELCR